MAKKLKSSYVWITKNKKSGHHRKKKNKYSEHNYTCYGEATEEQLKQNRRNNLEQHLITIEKKMRRGEVLSPKDEKKLVQLREALAA